VDVDDDLPTPTRRRRAVANGDTTRSDYWQGDSSSDWPALGVASVPTEMGDGPDMAYGAQVRAATGRPSTVEAYESPGRSAVLHLRLVVAMAVIGLVVGGAIGFVRAPIYKGQARLFVGKTLSLNNTAAIAGFPQAAAQIASDYARLVNTSTVTADAAKRLGHPNALGGSLSATPIPNSPIIEVDSTASTRQGAVALADAGAASLVDAVNQINQEALSQVTALEQSYANDETQIGQLNNELSAAQTLLANLTKIPAPSAAEQQQITSVQNQINQDYTNIQVANLRAGADSAQYQAQVSSLQGEEQVINRIGGASYTGNDRKTYLEIGLIAGLIAGLVVGVAVASLTDFRRTRLSRRAL
jgi:hypothetical protein